LRCITGNPCEEGQPPNYRGKMEDGYATSDTVEACAGAVRCATPHAMLNGTTLEANTIVWTGTRPSKWSITVPTDGSRAQIVCSTFPGASAGEGCNYMGVIEELPTSSRAGVCAVKVIGRAMLKLAVGAPDMMIGSKLYAVPWTQTISTTNERGSTFVGIVVAPGPAWHQTHVEVVIMH
jgi:hypothetical protein